ncbi:DUF488 domain-containing protein [Corynebacterium sp. CNCTC7651]|uniref:DUF488 domain-containing protein n=1 Tax=Corynebacterium TaxID=1716 RepID=UPI002101F6F3|nr:MULTISPECIES: DUF488 domain-containing protein [Corynebacterium]
MATLDALRDQAAETPTAVMCSEAVWWRCHRRIIADHLLAHGDEVLHVTGLGAEGASISEATLNEGAVIGDDPSCATPHRPKRAARVTDRDYCCRRSAPL